MTTIQKTIKGIPLGESISNGKFPFFNIDIEENRNSMGCVSYSFTIDTELRDAPDDYFSSFYDIEIKKNKYKEIIKKEFPDFDFEKITNLTVLNSANIEKTDSVYQIFFSEPFQNLKSITINKGLSNLETVALSKTFIITNAQELNLNTSDDYKAFSYYFPDEGNINFNLHIKEDDISFSADLLKSLYHYDFDKCYKTACLLKCNNINPNFFDIVDSFYGDFNYDKKWFKDYYENGYKFSSEILQEKDINEIKNAFKNRGLREPRNPAPFIAACETMNITPEELAQHFNFKRSMRGADKNISLYTRIILSSVLDNNYYNAALDNPAVNHLARKFCDSINDIELMKFIIKHPNLSNEEIIQIQNNKDSLNLQPTDSVHKLRSQLSAIVSEGEVESIERRYGIEFDKLKFDLKFSEVEMNGMKASILKPGDKRMVMLGYDTSCCQHLGGAGETAMMYGLVYDKAGFWAIEDSKTGKILAQAEIWEKNPDTLVFDNIEFADDKDVSKYAKIIGEWAKNSGYKNVYMGNGYNSLSENKGIKTIEGIKPPKASKVAQELGVSEIYTDADRECSVIKENNQVAEYFKDNHSAKALRTAIQQQLENEEEDEDEMLEWEEDVDNEWDSFPNYDVPAVETAFPHSIDDCIKPTAESLSKDIKENIKDAENIHDVLDLYQDTIDTLLPPLSQGSSDFDAFSSYPSIIDKYYALANKSFNKEYYEEEVKKYIHDALLLSISKYSEHPFAKYDSTVHIPSAYEEQISELLKNNSVDELKNQLGEYSLDDISKTIVNNSPKDSEYEMYFANDYGLQNFSFDSLNQFIEDSDISVAKREGYYRLDSQMRNPNNHFDELCEQAGLPNAEKLKEILSKAAIGDRELGVLAAVKYETAISEAFGDDKTPDFDLTEFSGDSLDSMLNNAYRFELNTDTSHLLFSDNASTIFENVEDVAIGDEIEMTARLLLDNGGEIKKQITHRYGEGPAAIKEEVVRWMLEDPHEITEEVVKNFPNATWQDITEFEKAVERTQERILDFYDETGAICSQIECELEASQLPDTEVLDL